MSQSNDVIEQKGPNQIVRIRSDSESNLDDLFKTVLQPKDSQVPLSLPMRLRNLPPSFFKQPERGSKSASHSRGSSADSTFSPPPPTSRPPSTTSLPIHHPRAHSSPASLQQTCQPSSANLTNELPLPPGWDMGKTATGQRYFINHATQTTTWQDPRQPSNTPAADLGPLPDGWEQATTADGETYFINHVDQTTSWADPRIPYSPGTTGVVRAALQLQRSRGGTGSTGGLNRAGLHHTGPPPPMVVSSNMLSNSQTFQLHQQKVRLQKLQMERERLRLRTKEILGQQNCVTLPNSELLLGRSIITEESAGSPTEDPFLSGDFHSRQESADSGLGLGSNYSLPHTPEDFLATMDDVSMDTEETMDSDDLVPSLQEQLNDDILSDVEAILGGSNQDNVLTWL